MTSFRTIGLAIVLAALAPAPSLFAQTTAPAPAAPPAPPAPPPAFEMRLGELMNAFIQPRHAKLALAGAEGNWPLTNYVLKELRQSFDGVSKAVPRWNRLPLGDMMKSLTAKPLNDLEEAVRLRDKEKFTTAMALLTRACNSCHTATDHSFIVITTPDQSGFPNQSFKPSR